ncbi:lamin tail domain-containing protein, partial [Streptomyces sp. NPDC001356]
YQDLRAYVWDNRSDTATLRNDRDRFLDEVSWATTATATARTGTAAAATEGDGWRPGGDHRDGHRD